MVATVLEAINRGLHTAMAEDERVVVLGEDVLDPYGGAFKVTRGLSDAYGDRVRTTPVSEAGIVGVATGMALRGLRPVVEIMFGDFTTLIVDQLANGAAKFRWMFDDQVRVPLVVRTPMGGRRGYGPTHSQSIEKLFLGVPGLRVLAPNALGDPAELLRTAIDDDNPVLFAENKVLYPMPVLEGDALTDFEIETATASAGAPTRTLRVAGTGAATITIAAHGHTAELAREALVALAFRHEVVAELVVVTQLAPCDTAAIEESVERTGRLLVVEEAAPGAGWGSEVIARVAQHLGPQLRASGHVAAHPSPIPAAGSLEQHVLPSSDDIVAAARAL